MTKKNLIDVVGKIVVQRACIGILDVTGSLLAQGIVSGIVTITLGEEIIGH